MTTILIALGANQRRNDADLRSTVLSSLDDLDQHYPVSVRQVSRMFDSMAFPPGSGPNFVNAVAEVSTDLTTAEFLTILHIVEEKFGRQRGVRWGPRTLDIDVLGRGDEVLPTRAVVRSWMEAEPVDGVFAAPSELVLPHPRLHERAFVLVPAHDVAPDWVHPILGQSISTLLANLPIGDQESVTPLD